MSRLGEPTRALVCPRCHDRADPAERFCPTCRLPLVLDEPEGHGLPVSEARERARKMKPQLAEGQLVRVAWAHNQSEAEFIQGLLLEEGVPSVLRRSAGFDVPDMLAAGPRDIMVARSGMATAHEVLLQAELIDAEPPPQPTAGPRRLLAGLLAALAVGVVVIWLMAQLIH
jgi:hypothetical protein